MRSKRRTRAAFFAVWVALLILLAVVVIPTSDLGALLASVFTRPATASRFPPLPTPTPVHEFPLQVALGQPERIIAWPFGPLYLNYGAGIARVGDQGDSVTITPFPVPAGVADLCAGPDGAVWFTEENAPRIGSLSAKGSIREFPLPGAHGASGITAGPDHAVWFTLPGAIGRITTGGDVTVFPLPSSFDTTSFGSGGGITAGPDGAIWFVEARAGRIARMTLGGVATDFAVPSGSRQLSSIAPGTDDALWFPEGPNALIGRITTTGQITEYPTPDAAANRADWLTGIAVGPDQGVWFAESTSHRIGRMTTDGVVTNEYRTSPEIRLGAFLEVTATATAIWFTEPDQRTIGRIDLDTVMGSGNNR